MNIQRKLQQELYIEHNPIGIVADASCSWPFDFNAQPILSQSANYLGHDISDERNKDALELFYLSSDRNHWPESSMSDYERGSVERAINAQLESKAAVLFLAADPRLIPKSSSLKDCLADVLSNKASQTTRQSLMVSQVMDCHSAFAGQAAVQQALTQSLPAILEQTLQETASKPELQKALSAMQLIKTQVNYLNSKLFSWFVFDDWALSETLNAPNEWQLEQHQTTVDKWFGSRPVMMYHQQTMNFAGKKHSFAASITLVVEQLLARCPNGAEHADVFFSFAGELREIEKKGWWQQLIKRLFDAGLKPHLTLAPLSQAISMGPKSMTIALIAN